VASRAAVPSICDMPRITPRNEESRRNVTRSPTRGPVGEDMQKSPRHRSIHDRVFALGGDSEGGRSGIRGV